MQYNVKRGEGLSLALKFRDVATRLLSKFDERVMDVDSIQLEQTSIVFNPVTGEDEPGTPVITNLVGISVRFDEEFTNSASTDGNTIQAGDQLLKITDTTEPKMRDKILMDGMKYSIVSISPSSYTGLVLLFSVHIRR